MKKIIFGLIVTITSFSIIFPSYGMGKVIPKKTPMQRVGNGTYCWTPDGKIAFYRLIDHWIKMEPDPFPGGGGVYDDYEKDDEAFIVVRDPETKEEKVLFKVPYGHTASGVYWMDWSGVNNEILMTVFGAGVYRIKANGTDLRLIGFGDKGPIGGFKQATWMPDGKNIISIASHPPKPGEKIEECIGVYIMDRDGKNSKMIVSNADAFSISPDGKQVVYQTLPRRWKDEKGEYAKEDIYIINIDGTGKRLLVEGGQNPKWSPDGKWIMFHIGGETYLVSPTEDEKCFVNGYGLLSKNGKSVLSSDGHIGQLKVIDETFGGILKSRKESNGYIWRLSIIGREEGEVKR